MCVVFYVRTCKITGVDQFISALSNWCRDHDLGVLPRGYLYQRVRKGLLNVFALSESTSPKHAISLDQLSSLYTHMDFTRFSDARDWCMYVRLLCIASFAGVL